MFNIDATDANTGTFTHFTEQNTSWDQIVEAAMASSSIPGVFPSTKMNGKVYFDGGVIWTADFSSGI
jgi:predicted acylesterase/phospholipase RssA